MQRLMKKTSFYRQIEDYYDADAGDFDARYLRNPVLQRIRQDFREEVKRYPFSRMLEIGYGTGLDLIHFARIHPDAEVFGIDISGEMCRISREKITSLGLSNARAAQGSVEDIASAFPGKAFDMIYVFFGALNTVEDLSVAASTLSSITTPGGLMVLSFVNKHYLAGMFIESLKFRFRAAFSRLRKEWGGYSPTQYLPSRCYSPSEVQRAFQDVDLIRRRAYSILHPAWYYHGLNRRLGRLRRVLWWVDKMLNKTPLWRFGEYSLFVFQKPDGV